MIAAVLLPAILVGLRALRLLLAVADGLQGVCAHPSLEEGLLGGVGAALAQSQVVFGGTAFVAVAFNLHLPPLLLDELCSLSKLLLRIGPQIGLVIVEVNVSDHLSKELLVRNGRRRWSRCGRRSRGCDCDLGRGFLRSASTFGYQMIGSGLSG